MNLEYRLMRPEEAPAVQTLIRSCFSYFYYAMVEKPKEAVIALDGDRIVGGSVFKTIKLKDKGIGYLEWGFTDSEYRGKGIGRTCYKQALDLMSNAGCSDLTSMVLDDNSASWRQFSHEGFKRITLMQAISRYGLGGTFKLWFSTFSVFAMGSSLWFSSEKDPIVERRDTTLTSYLMILLCNLLIILGKGLLLGRSFQANAMTFLAFVCFLSIMVSLKFLIISPKMRPVLRMWRTGQFIPIIVMLLGGVFPFYGDVYPDKGNDWDVREYRKIFGISSAVCWVITALFSVASTILPESRFFYALSNYAVMFLFLNILTIIFESFDGARVLRWNKTIYYVLTVISIIIVIWLMF